MKSDISFVTDDPEYVKCYNQINQIILDNLGPVYKTNPVDYEQFLIGHGIFCKKDLGRVLKYQIVPLIQQYVAEGILTKSAKTAISQTASTYVPQAVVTPTSDTIIEDLPLGITPEIFKDQPRNNPKMPITNLLGRIVEQNLLPHEDIVSKILLNTNYFRTRQKNGQMASLIATKEQKEIFARADKSRSWYNGSCLHINGNEYWTKGGMQGGEIVYDKPYPFILEETTSPNVILNGIVLAYYEPPMVWNSRLDTSKS